MSKTCIVNCQANVVEDEKDCIIFSMKEIDIHEKIFKIGIGHKDMYPVIMLDDHTFVEFTWEDLIEAAIQAKYNNCD